MNSLEFTSHLEPLHQLSDALGRSLYFFDLETTSLHVKSEEFGIIQMGFVAVRGNPPVKEFQTLINPERSISDFIEHLTGLSAKQCYQAETFERFMPLVIRLLKETILVGFNIETFDLPALLTQIERYEGQYLLPDEVHFIDLRKAWMTYSGGKRGKLVDVARAFNIDFDPESAHNALADTRACVLIAQQMAQECGIEFLIEHKQVMYLDLTEEDEQEDLDDILGDLTDPDGQ